MENSGYRMGIFGWLTLTFIILKIVGIINWSWIWVLAPFWGFAVIVFTVLIVIVLVKGEL